MKQNSECTQLHVTGAGQSMLNHLAVAISPQGLYEQVCRCRHASISKHGIVANLSSGAQL